MELLQQVRAARPCGRAGGQANSWAGQRLGSCEGAAVLVLWCLLAYALACCGLCAGGCPSYLPAAACLPAMPLPSCEPPQMQQCGQPPQEIVDELAPGMQFGPDGLPSFGSGGVGDEALPPELRDCAVM